jgi:hypothetical protein
MHSSIGEQATSGGGVFSPLKRNWQQGQVSCGSAEKFRLGYIRRIRRSPWWVVRFYVGSREAAV